MTPPKTLAPLLAPLLVVTLAGALAGAGTLQFAERSAGAGLTGGHAAVTDFGLQYMAPGAAVGDFDRDGDQDLFVIGGSAGVDQLYINDGTGGFTEQAAQWGVDAAGIRHNGVAVGDYDSDGWLDVYVTCLGSGSNPVPVENRLYRNNGDGTFTDVAAAAGVQVPPRGLSDSFGAAFGDVDLDGDLDLFVAGWYGGNHLYLNNGDGTFTVQPDSVFGGEPMDLIRGFAPRITDINADGQPDIMLVADFQTSKVFINNGDGTFTNQTTLWGAGLDSNGMGNTIADFNNDLLLDWYVTSRLSPGGGQYAGSGNMLYINNGDSTFTESSVAAGVNDGQWGWGTEGVDFDHDGWVDIVATNGWNGPYFEIDPTHLWLNNADGTFTDVRTQVGIAHTGQGRGLLTFDADRDGDRDILICNNAEPITYYENQLSGPDASSITLEFVTAGTPDLAPDGFGTRVEIDAGGMTQLRVLDGGSNYLAQSELSVHAGLGASAAADEVRITWANGETTTLRNVAAGRHTITARLDCPIDWDVNNLLDLADISGWIQAFGSGHPQADLNADGLLDLADIGLFIGLFTTGCQ